MKNLKNIVFIAVISVFILAFSAFELFCGSEKYSLTERRTLAQKPQFSLAAVSSGKFMSDFEVFTQDQAPGRNEFRHIKALLSKYVFGLTDNHGIFSCGAYVSQLNYPANYEKTDITLSKLIKVYNSFIKDSDCRVFLSVIPDKNYFLRENMALPTINYEEYCLYVREKLDCAEYIDLFPALCLQDYYRTDQHWNQLRIAAAAKSLVEGMGNEFTPTLYASDTEIPFRGAYVGLSGLDFEPDIIGFFESPALDKCIVTSYNSGKAQPSYIYDMDKAVGRDPYELFLGGSDALLTIENPDAQTDRGLIIFRDSFASSITPLMVESYSEITLVDLRYIMPELLGSFIEFNNQDVLFLYSTLVLNSGV